jgi:excisionase family DNA binding protein
MNAANLRALVATTSLGDLPQLIGDLAAAHAEALARVLASQSVPPPTRPDENLAIDEAARRLGVSKDYLYRHADHLPFALRIGRRLLFSEAGLEKWNRTRQRS